MEITYNELKKKEVVNTLDGKKLGRVCDLVFCYPENRILGFVVPGSRAFGFKKEEYFIDLKNIVKIGEDVILVNIGFKGQRPIAIPPAPPAEPRRSFEEYE